MRRITAFVTALVFVLLTLTITIPAYAHGVLYESAPIGDNKIRVTLKWSDPGEKRGLRVAYFNIKNGKTVNIGYEATASGPSSTSIDLDLTGALLPLRFNLAPAGVLDYAVFNDVKGIEAEEYITHLHDAGIVNGRNADSFVPEDSITRAEFATMVVKALKLEGSAENAKGFTDIQGHWAEKIMLLAAKNGILSGYGDSTLRPDNTITVAEASTIITRAFTFKTVNNGFYTRLKQGEWYSAAVKNIFDMGILRVTDGIYKNFNEEANITRAECATLISRALSTY